MKLEKRHDTLYAEALKYYSKDQIEHLLSHSLEELESLDLCGESENDDDAIGSYVGFGFCTYVNQQNE